MWKGANKREKSALKRASDSAKDRVNYEPPPAEPATGPSPEDLCKQLRDVNDPVALEQLWLTMLDRHSNDDIEAIKPTMDDMREQLKNATGLDHSFPAPE